MKKTNNHRQITIRYASRLILTIAAGWTAQAQAVPFAVHDIDALGMGGAGVASAIGSGSTINPSLLMARKRLPGEFMQYINGQLVKEDSDGLNSALKSFQGLANTSGTPTASRLEALAGKTERWEYQGSATTVILSKSAASSVMINTYSYQSAQVRVDPADVAALTSGSVPANYNSTLQLRGVTVVEAGVNFASRQIFQNSPLGELLIGITPKIVMGKIHENNEPITTAEIPLVNSEGENKTKLTLDLGVTKEFGRLWTAGLVVKNLIPSRIGSGPNSVILGPQLRGGVAMHRRWGTAALDLDLTANGGVGTLGTSQLIAAGIDVGMSDNLRLRAGYNHDLRGAREDTLSLGLGTTMAVMRIEAVYLKRPSGDGVAAQVGLTF